MPTKGNDPLPLRWGFDDAGSHRRIDKLEWAPDMLEEFGFDTWIHHYAPAATVAGNLRYLDEVDGFCHEQGISWLPNIEHSNWNARYVDDQGRDWTNRPDGRHYWLFPDDVLEHLSQCASVGGIMYDEAAHTQNCANQMAEGIDQPYIYDPAHDTLNAAADAFSAAARKMADHHARYGLKLYTEHVFPVMFHGFARGGWTAGTKVLKENWSPAYLACAMEPPSSTAPSYGRRPTCGFFPITPGIR